MKEKFVVSGSHFFQGTFQLRCWTPVSRNRQSILKCLLRRYQKVIDVTFAVTIIGTMILIGIWRFLVQLAEL